MSKVGGSLPVPRPSNTFVLVRACQVFALLWTDRLLSAAIACANGLRPQAQKNFGKHSAPCRHLILPPLCPHAGIASVRAV